MKKKSEKDQNRWEETCCKCGRCCYEKIDFEGNIYYTDLPCEFLDLKTNLCRVYEDRDIKRPGCIRLTRKSLHKGFLPEDCPYVANIEDYPAPSMPDEPDSENS